MSGPISAPGITVARARALAAPTLFRSHSPLRPTFNTVGAQVTFSTAFELDGHYSLVRFGFWNIGAAWTMGGVIAAPSASLASPWAPVDSAGAAQAWTTCYFNAAGANVEYDPLLSGTTSTLAMPSTGVAALPAIAWTDWTAIKSIARTDGGTSPLVFVRALIPTSSQCASYGAKLTTDWANPAINQGRLIRSGYMTGDKVTTNQTGFTAGNETLSLVPVVQYYADVPGGCVLTIGDSITQGYTTTSDYNSWGHIATASLRNAGLKLSYHNAGIGGQTSAQFMSRGKGLIDACRPNVVFLFPYTPNDGYPVTQANVDASWARCLGMAQYSKAKGAVPILATPVPWNTLNTEAKDAQRMVLANRVKASGFQYVDFNGLLGDGATPVRFRAEYDSGDGEHPGDAGHAAMAALAAEAIRSALAP